MLFLINRFLKDVMDGCIIYVLGEGGKGEGWG
jgi:hypothetical protein